MSFIICRQNDKTRKVEYVTEPGSKKSFTPHISRARRFLTQAQAEADRCPQNEWICTL